MEACRTFLKEMFETAVAAARGGDLLANNAAIEDNTWIYRGGDNAFAVPLPEPGSGGRVIVAGAGKAAAAMARGLQTVLGDRIAAGALVVKYGHGERLDRIAVHEAGHPIPNRDGFVATEALRKLLAAARAEDTVFFLLSGGASALLVAPANSLRWEDKAAVSEQLIRSPASIAEINTVRKHFSAVKGGWLRAGVTARAFCTLALSDVIGDDPATIGSGPTVPDPTTFRDALAVMERHGLMATAPAAAIVYLRRGQEGMEKETPKAFSFTPERMLYRVIASNRLSVAAVVRTAQARGWKTRVVSLAMDGNTHAAAEAFAGTLRAAPQGEAKPLLLIAGGETTLTVRGHGRGGRNQEFAVIAARALQGVANVALLSAGTDGSDGPTDAAGAIVDGTTIARAQAAGFDVARQLADNDVYPMLEGVDALYRTGPTGTNVMDLVLGAVI